MKNAAVKLHRGAKSEWLVDDIRGVHHARIFRVQIRTQCEDSLRFNAL